MHIALLLCSVLLLANFGQAATAASALLEHDLFWNGASDGHATRHRRAPAIWGEPAPDYSAVQLHGEAVYLYALLFVDAKISDHYNSDETRLKSEVMKLAEEANRYFYQVAMRLVVVDVIETHRNDLTLYTFEQFRHHNIRELPYHNFAALVSYRHAGGLAFVSGMCSAKSVMLTGFYPHNPEAMGSIFFHEVAHLIGVPHSHVNDTLSVPNCACASTASDGISVSTEDALRPRQLPNLPVERDKDAARPTRMPRTSSGCLRIPGFDHDCTLQLMANLVQRNRCLRRQPLYASMLHDDKISTGIPRYGDDDDDMNALYSSGRPANERVLHGALSSLPLCDNGVVERGEECDCGLPHLCTAWNCDPATCTRPVPLWVMYLCTAMLTVSVLAPLLAYAHLQRRYHSPRDFCWAQAAALYGCLPHGAALPRRLRDWRYWRQDGGNKWSMTHRGDSAAAITAAATTTTTTSTSVRNFLQRRLSASALARDSDAKCVASQSGCATHFLSKTGVVGAKSGAIVHAYHRLVSAAHWPRRFCRSENPPHNDAIGGMTPESAQDDNASMKLMRALAPSTCYSRSSERSNSDGGGSNAGYAAYQLPTPRCAWTSVWPPPAPSQLRTIGPTPLRASARPRVRPPSPPPTLPVSAAVPPAITISGVENSVSATKSERNTLKWRESARTSQRPKLPPPPRPVDSRPTSPAISECTSASYSMRNGTRHLLPPPPPPPIKCRASPSSPNNIVRTANSLPRPPSFAPPKTPEPSLESERVAVYDMRAVPRPENDGAHVALNVSSGAESIKLAPLSIINSSTAAIASLPVTNATPSLLEQIEAEAARRLAQHVFDNDLEDRYSISHKFADFDDDDLDFQSDCDENSYSAV